MANCKASGFLRLRGLGCNDRFGPVALTRVSYAGPVYASRWQLQLRLRSLDRDLSRGPLRSSLSRWSGLVPEGLHPGQRTNSSYNCGYGP